jgi:IS4 transposase
VRLIRQLAPNGAVRVLITNLFDTQRFPATVFAEFYHQRWRIEEAFKRLKHHLDLELVSHLYGWFPAIIFVPLYRRFAKGV